MFKAGKPRKDRIAAWTMVFIVHALLAWMLLRVPAPVRDAPRPDSALDVIWVAAPRPMPEPPQRARSTAAAPSAAPVRRASMERVAPALAARATSAPASAQLSAVFIQPAIEATTRPAPGALQTDPFANRAARLPGRAANTFRMRPPPSLAERVAQVGKLFGGGDDPCRSARDSINELSQAGDSRVLQDALDYEKRFCR